MIFQLDCSIAQYSRRIDSRQMIRLAAVLQLNEYTMRFEG